MYGGFTDCTKHASAAALIHQQQTLYWLFAQTKLSSMCKCVNRLLTNHNLQLLAELLVLYTACLKIQTIYFTTEINLLSLIHVLGLDET